MFFEPDWLQINPDRTQYCYYLLIIILLYKQYLLISISICF